MPVPEGGHCGGVVEKCSEGTSLRESGPGVSHDLDLVIPSKGKNGSPTRSAATANVEGYLYTVPCGTAQARPGGDDDPLALVVE